MRARFPIATNRLLLVGFGADPLRRATFHVLCHDRVTLRSVFEDERGEPLEMETRLLPTSSEVVNQIRLMAADCTAHLFVSVKDSLSAHIWRANISCGNPRTMDDVMIRTCCLAIYDLHHATDTILPVVLPIDFLKSNFFGILEDGLPGRLFHGLDRCDTFFTTDENLPDAHLEPVTPFDPRLLHRIALVKGTAQSRDASSFCYFEMVRPYDRVELLHLGAPPHRERETVTYPGPRQFRVQLLQPSTAIPRVYFSPPGLVTRVSCFENLQ